MNTFAIEASVQNGLIGQVVMMNIYSENDYALAFVVLYPVLNLFLTVSIQEKISRNINGNIPGRYDSYRMNHTVCYLLSLTLFV